MGQLKLFDPKDSKVCLNAYLACALTGLDKDQRHLVFQLSDITSLICNKHGIDLYEPRKATDPVHHPDVSDTEVFKTDRERVLNSDLLIHLTHYASTGSGIELEFANSALLPLLLVARDEDRVSRMITGIPGFKVHLSYSEPEEFRNKLDNCLSQIKPILLERKLSFSEYDINIVGARIQYFREELGLSRQELSDLLPSLTGDQLNQIEENKDKISNPNLLQLRQLATVLKTTVADLVEPNLESFVLSSLHDLMVPQESKAARYGTSRDKNKILRRVLLRVIDSLED